MAFRSWQLNYSNHTQSTAYLVGETAAVKIIEEYKLDIGTTASLPMASESNSVV